LTLYKTGRSCYGAIGLATPFFLVFGALSDKVGRKWIMLTGMLLGVVLYRPIFREFLKETDIKVWMQSEYKFVKEEKTFVMHGKDSVLKISTQYETADLSKFTKVTNDTLFKINRALDQPVNVNSSATYINKVVNKPTYIKFIFLVWS
jgi:hypothetical protein